MLLSAFLLNTIIAIIIVNYAIQLSLIYTILSVVAFFGFHTIVGKLVDRYRVSEIKIKDSILNEDNLDPIWVSKGIGEKYPRFDITRENKDENIDDKKPDIFKNEKRKNTIYN